MDMGQRKNTKKSTLRTILLMMVIAILVIFVYYQGVNKERPIQEVTQKSEIDILLQKDLKEKYPATPREVVKLYLRITQCYYNEKLSKEELTGLAKQAYALFDDELREKNTWDDYVERLKTDISEYAESEKKMDHYSIDKGSAVRHYMKDGKEYASLMTKIVFMDPKYKYNMSEQFILRKDQENRYKILGWKMAEEADIDEK